MRLDEMIIKANADGKVYVHEKDQFTYSKFAGFLSCDKSMFSLDMGVYIDGWEELPKRHLTVSEAEKELDCVIDAPDISELLRSPKEPPSGHRNVIVLIESDHVNHTSFYDKNVNTWYVRQSGNWVESCAPICWIDPADLIKLLPKE